MANRNVALMLDVLDTIPRHGRPRSYKQIAAVLGCNWQYVWEVEQKAIRKMRREHQRRRERERLQLAIERSPTLWPL